MTSGTFTSLPINSIFVARDDRQRKRVDPAAVKNLAASIAKIGLIHPIVVERSGNLRVGETRLEACKLLGWSAISVQFTDELDEAALQLMELDENIKRSALTWQEECDAIARYHALRRAGNAQWTQAQTAEALGTTQAEIAQKLIVQKELINPVSKVHNATKYSEALTITKRLSDRRAAASLAVLDNKPIVTTTVPILNADFNQWARGYDGPNFNFIHCDFPYGINADNQQQGGNVSTLGGYADSADIYWELLDTLEFFMSSGVAPSAHLMFWFSMRHYQKTLVRLTTMGWRVDPFPLTWLKSDNMGLLPDPLRGPRRITETAFFASRGDRKIVQPVSNAIASPTTKLIHMSEKSLPVLDHFFRMLVDEHTTFFDPTGGSCNGARVARSRGAGSILSLERDPDFFKLATEHFNDDD